MLSCFWALEVFRTTSRPTERVCSAWYRLRGRGLGRGTAGCLQFAFYLQCNSCEWAPLL